MSMSAQTHKITFLNTVNYANLGGKVQTYAELHIFIMDANNYDGLESHQSQ